MSKRRVTQIALIAIASLIMAGLAVQQAVADLAGCSNCIEQGDIANDAVGSGEIKTGAVGKAEITTNAVGGSEIIDSAIKKVDIGSDAVGLSELTAGVTPVAGEITLSGSTSSTSAETIDSFTVDAPAAGYLMVNASGRYYFDYDATDANSVTNFGQIALCTAANTLSSTDCGDTPTNLYYQDADSASSLNHTPFYTLWRVVPVVAGNNTFYVNGVAISASDPLNILFSRGVALFVPGTLTMS